MADTEKTSTTLLDELVALDREQRSQLAEALCKIAETFAEVPDGRRTAHTLGYWPTGSTRPERHCACTENGLESDHI